MKQDGLARHIGVSNFTVAQIAEAVAVATEPLVCDQVECHPYLDQSKVFAACRAHGMATVAYSRSPAATPRTTGVLARIGAAQKNPRRKSACAIWCSRRSSSFRAPANWNG